MNEVEVDVAIIGGGVGGVAAAIAACRSGASVCITEETDWLGGQLTNQGVPPDEHPWIEQFGCTASYRDLRNRIRDHYREYYPLTPAQSRRPDLNPGQGMVSRLCHEPRVAHLVIQALLSPFVASGHLRILLERHPVDVEVDGDRIRSVALEGLGGQNRIRARMFLDGSELGELLELAGAEHVTGFESRADTGEPSAPAQAQPANMQAFSWVFAMEHLEGEDHTIDPPEDWDAWRSYRPDFWPAPMISLTSPAPRTLEPTVRDFTPHAGVRNDADQSIDPGDQELWTFRRALARESFAPGFLTSDVVLANWPMIDYLGGPLIGVSAHERKRHCEAARQQSLAMMYWLQTEAPRPGGGRGWPGLRLRGDVLGTTDGLAKAPYIRESRRIRSQCTITEQDVSLAVRGDAGAVEYPDSIGVGMYRIDLHPSTGGDTYIDVPSSPFQIPLGALIPVRMSNLLPAGKSIGTTHITNGCYRLHPVEWNVGEAAGELAALCVGASVTPSQVRNDASRLRRFQERLRERGVETAWPQIKGY